VNKLRALFDEILGKEGSRRGRPEGSISRRSVGQVLGRNTNYD